MRLYIFIIKIKLKASNNMRISDRIKYEKII